MKLIYTSENRFLVSNMKNIVERSGISVTYRNEFAVGAMGELGLFDSWLELWVFNDSDVDDAKRIIEVALSAVDSAEWVCNECQEINDASFEICWNCQHSNKSPK